MKQNAKSARAGVLSALALFAQVASAGVLYDFHDVTSLKDSHYDPSELVTSGTKEPGLGSIYGSLMSSDEIYHRYQDYGGARYGVLYNNMPGFGPSWHGFAWSSMTNKEAKGTDGQYTSVTGSGYNGSSNYLVYYGDGVGLGISRYSEDGNATIGVSSPDVDIEGMWITNTSYAYYSMKEGDGYNDKFEAGDYFKLVITGWDVSGEDEIGSCEVFLGNGDEILDTWYYVDVLGEIGSGVGLLSFAFEQYDASGGKTYKEHACKVPIDFVLGALVTSGAVPEPSVYAAVFGAASLVFAVARKKRRAA